MDRLKTFIDGETVIDAETLNGIQDKAESVDNKIFEFDVDTMSEEDLLNKYPNIAGMADYVDLTVNKATSEISADFVPQHAIHEEYNSGWDQRTGQILSQPGTVKYISAQGFQKKSNLITVLSDVVTDDQYPSAKAVWELFNSIANGDEVEY